MSAPNKNWLVKKVNSILFFLKLKVKPIYFYEWTADEYEEVKSALPEAFARMDLYTNYGNKDIIIDNEIRPIIHIVNKGHARINLPSHNSITFNNVLFEETKSNPIFMLAASKKLKGCTVNQHQITPSYIGTMIFSKAINAEHLKFSSLEI